MECVKCKRKDIKYRCIGCKIPICNVCSLVCSTETPGYCEENYLVGKCADCQVSSKGTIPESSSATKQETKTRQSSLSSFFNIQNKVPEKPLPCAKSDKSKSKIRCSSSSSLPVKKAQELSVTKTAPTEPFHSSGSKTSSTSTSVPAKKARNLSVEAAKRWKTTSLAGYSASQWLVVNSDITGSVTSLNCSVCNAYAEHIKGMKNFLTVWAYAGSTNLRLSNAEDHARGEPHKRAMDLHLKRERGMSVVERAEALTATMSPGQQLITAGIANMQSADLAKTKLKFEVAYFIAKEELSLTKYPELLKLEEKHGVEIGSSYRNRISCANFIYHIGQELAEKLEEKLRNVNFFSVLTDSSEDASICEKEAIFVQHLDTSPPGRDTIQVVTSFLQLADLKYGTADGIVSSIKSSFQSINLSDDFGKKLIGFAGDGATVNRGEEAGVIGILRRELPWVIYVWCVAHRLELSLKDALKGTCFDAVDEMLLRLYYLYENSPKKLRQLRDLHQLYSQTFEFEEEGIRPKRASGKVFFFYD